MPVRPPIWSVVVGVVIALAAVVCLVYRMSGVSTPSVRPEATAASVPGEHDPLRALRPVVIPVGLLDDYYEHNVEHVPPRDPSGSMQRRERWYSAPPDPFERLSSAAYGKPNFDSQFRAKLAAWEQRFVSGEIDMDGLEDITWLAERSSLPAEPLVEAARGVQFLAGDRVAAAFFDVALDKATQQYKDQRPGDVSALPVLHSLDQTKALWRVRDYRALEKRFALAMALYPELSIESRRAGCLYATALYYQGHASEAADVILKVWAQDKRVGDLGRLEKSDLGEMDWVTGFYLMTCGRYNDAIPYYREFLSTEDPRKQDAAKFLANCLSHTGKPEEATRIRQQFNLPEAPTRPRHSRSPDGG